MSILGQEISEKWLLTVRLQNLGLMLRIKYARRTAAVAMTFILFSQLLPMLNGCALPADQYRYDLHLQRAEKALSRGDLSGAAFFYGGALDFAIQRHLTNDAKETAMYNLGRVFRMQGRYRDAESYLTQAMALQEKLDPESANMTRVCAELGRAFYFQGKYKKAAPLMKRCLAIMDKMDIWSEAEGLQVRFMGSYLEQVADVLRRLDRKSEAENIETRIRSLIAKNAPDAPLVFDDSLAVTTIPLGMFPAGVAVDSGIVWVAQMDGDVVSMIDADTTRVIGEPIQVGRQPAGVALTQDALWVANRLDATVSRIDLRTHQVVATIPVGGEPRLVAAGPDALWVANFGGGWVSRIDPQRNQVIAKIPVGKAVLGIAVGGGAVWVSDYVDGTVSRIDPQSNQVIAKVPVGAEPSFVAYGEGAVWISNIKDSAVSKIDPKTNRVIAKISTGWELNGMAIGCSAVWVTSADNGVIIRLDPQANQVIGKPIRVGFGALHLAIAEDDIWVVNRESETLSRINLSICP